MPTRPLLTLKLAAWTACFLLLAGAGTGKAATTFDQVQPILVERCVLCHAGAAAPLGLQLDSFEGVLKGSARGPVVKSGDSAGSELIRRLRGDSLPRMPMTGPPYLSDAQVALIANWIDGGLSPAPASPPTVATAPASAAAAAPARANDPPTYVDVAPIFATRCAKCHAAQGLMGAAPEGLRLTSLAETLASGERARVVPGQPQASELLRRIKGQARPRMPFDGPPYLSEAEIDLIERWIAAGARDAEGRPAPLPVGADVRLHGTLDGAASLDGWTFTRTPATRVDKRPQPGDYVQLRGRIGADGSVAAERLRKR